MCRRKYRGRAPLMFIVLHCISVSFLFTESPVTAVAPSLVFGELSVEVPSTTSTETNLVTTVKETLTSLSYSRLIAEVEKQYVAVTPPDSPEPMGLVCFNHNTVVVLLTQFC